MVLSACLYDLVFVATKFEACNMHTSEKIEEVIIALILKSSLSKLNALYNGRVQTGWIGFDHERRQCVCLWKRNIYEVGS